jgi:UDP-N-acetylglucosamine transferase subunit ALG13
LTFVTLGTQNFPFNRLLELIDRLVAEGVLRGGVFAQTGCSTYVPRHFSHVDFLAPEEYNRYIAESDLIIAHAGVGTIMSCLSRHKKLIVVPRTEKHGEHVDDHQFEIAEEFARKGHLLTANDYDGLKAAVLAIPTAPLLPYQRAATPSKKRSMPFSGGSNAGC